MKPPPLAEISPRRILVLKPSALGDIVHALPVLAGLRQRYPGAHLGWVVNRVYEPVLTGHPDLDEVVVFDRHAARVGLWKAMRSLLDFLRLLRRNSYDLVIDLQGLLRTGIMCLSTGAPRRVGLSTAREGSRRCYTDVVPIAEPEKTHAVDRYWAVVRAMGVDGPPAPFHLPVQPLAEAWAKEALAPLPRPWMVVAAGSRWATKRWHTSHFAQLAQKGLSQFGGSVVLVGGPDESNLSAEVCASLHGPVADFTGKTTLPQLTAVLALADVVIANDTGPLHMAVALGRPVVAPYTCSRIMLTGPYCGGAVQTEVSCQGSLIKHCSHMSCMQELTPDRLWPLLHRVLREWQTQNQIA
jgi:lipopolysaccharide heptosyltransferase I